MFARSNVHNTNNKIVHQLLQNLPKEDMNQTNYVTLLCDLLITGKSSQFPNITLEQLTLTKPLEKVREKLYQALYRLRNNTGFININKNAGIVDFLIWGYELRAKGIESVSLQSFQLVEFSIEQLAAFWEAISFSQVKVLRGLHGFERLATQASAEALKISCKGIAQSHLTHFSWNEHRRHFPNFQLSTEQWRFFWQSLKLAKVEHLDLSHLSLPVENFDEYWHILCQGLTNSAFKSLNIADIFFNFLTEEHWHQLYQALQTVQLESLDISGAKFTISANRFEEVDVDERHRVFILVCNILSLPSLKKLTWQCGGFDPEFIFPTFCKAIAKSRIEALEVNLENINLNANSDLCDSLKKMSLKSLAIKCSSLQNMPEFFTELCSFIGNSELTHISIDNLILNSEQWQMFAQSFSKRGIRVFHCGLIELEYEGFYNFLETSGVETLHIPNHLDNEKENLAKLTTHLQNSAISKLILESQDLCRASREIWEAVHNLITKTKLKELQCTIQSFDRFDEGKLRSLCKAIRFGKLETLDLGFNPSLNSMKPEAFQALFEAIRLSNISCLSFEPLLLAELDPDKAEIAQATLAVVETRAHHKGSLFGMCASTLFWQCNAQLTEQGICYKVDQKSRSVDLQGGSIDILRPFV